MVQNKVARFFMAHCVQTPLMFNATVCWLTSLC